MDYETELKKRVDWHNMPWEDRHPRLFSALVACGLMSLIVGPIAAAVLFSRC